MLLQREGSHERGFSKGQAKGSSGLQGPISGSAPPLPTPA